MIAEVTNSKQHMIALGRSMNILIYIVLYVTSVHIFGFSKPDLGTLPSVCLGRMMTSTAWEDVQSRYSKMDHFVIWVLGHRGYTDHFLLFNNFSEARQLLEFLFSF